MEVSIQTYSGTLGLYMNGGNRCIIKDRAHKIVGILLVFTSTCTLSFFPRW